MQDTDRSTSRVPHYREWIDPSEAARNQHAEIARLTGLAHGRMLELDCGDGLYLKYFQDQGWECLGTTVSEADYQNAFQNEVLTLQGPLDELNIPQESYDIVRIRGAHHHATDPGFLLETAYRATHPTGYLVIDGWNRNGWPHASSWQNEENRFSKRHLHSLLREAGFEGGGLFAPALGDPVWFPLRKRGFSLSRMLDSVQAFFDRGSMLVGITQRPPKQTH